MKEILERYLERTVGVNYRRPYHIEAATLNATTDAYFLVLGHADNTLHTFPYANVVQVLENDAGVKVGGLFQHKETFPMVVKVGHIMDPSPIV